MHLFYTPDLNQEDKQYLLSEEESKHCIRVLRLKENDPVVLIDGIGGWYDAVIKDAHPKRTYVQINTSKHGFQKRNHFLHIAIAPTKNIDRFEWFLEKATEIGVDEITPVICAHSERKEVKIERLNKRITAAMKQSLKSYHPVLNQPVSFQEFIKQKQKGNCFIAHCDQGDKQDLKDVLTLESSSTILIGPEGDFSTDEIALALKTGWMPTSLGESRLRTETAALAACFEVNYLNRSN